MKITEPLAAADDKPVAVAADEPPAVAADGLRRSYDDVVAVDDVSLHIAAGESYGLLGPNGAGKTTTIEMLMGLLRRDAGTVAIAGHDLDTDALAAKSAIGFVPQDLALYPDLTALENLRFFGRLYGLDRAALTARVDATLELVGLTERAGDRVDTFSGGMKRRLNIAAGLLHEPRLLVLDEPTVGVDPQSRNAILEGVEALATEGMAILYTSHYMEEVERLCDRVGIIDHGKLIAEGTRRELVAQVGERDRIEVGLAPGADGELARTAASSVEHVLQVDITATAEAPQTLRALADDASAVLPALLAALAAHGVTVRTVQVVQPDLEAVFLHLTGRTLRD